VLQGTRKGVLPPRTVAGEHGPFAGGMSLCVRRFLMEEELKMAKTWYPIIDRDKCQECNACVDFCTHGVYEQGANGEPVVANPDNCVEFCRGCSKICPAEAIHYYGDEG